MIVQMALCSAAVLYIMFRWAMISWSTAGQLSSVASSVVVHNNVYFQEYDYEKPVHSFLSGGLVLVLGTVSQLVYMYIPALISYGYNTCTVAYCVMVIEFTECKLVIHPCKAGTCNVCGLERVKVFQRVTYYV